MHVLRPGQVWQLCLLLDYATLTTQQPGKVRPYRVSERWDDDVSLWCLRFSPLDFVVFLLCVSVNFLPICWGRVSHQSWTVKPFNPLCTWNRIVQTFLLGCSSYWVKYKLKTENGYLFYLFYSLFSGPSAYYTHLVSPSLQNYSGHETCRKHKRSYLDPMLPWHQGKGPTASVDITLNPHFYMKD